MNVGEDSYLDREGGHFVPLHVGLNFNPKQREKPTRARHCCLQFRIYDECSDLKGSELQVVLVSRFLSAVYTLVQVCISYKKVIPHQCLFCLQCLLYSLSAIGINILCSLYLASITPLL